VRNLMFSYEDISKELLPLLLGMETAGNACRRIAASINNQNCQIEPED